MKKPVLTRIALCLTAIMALLPSPALPATDSLVTIVEAYFSSLKETIDQSTASPIVKSSHDARLFGYLGGIMEKNPPIRSLMKVDAKGMVRCERRSGQNHAQKKRSVAKQQWFSQTAKNKKEYDCLSKDKNGLVSLYWSIPLMQEKAGFQRLNGAMVAVVDLRACFRLVARQNAQPFLVRMDDANFYAHLWKKTMIFIEDRLSVPGAENITIRYQKSNVSLPESETLQKPSPESSRVNQTIAYSGADSSHQAEGAAQIAPVPAAKKNMPIIVSLSILIVIVTVLLIFQVIARINRNRSERAKGNKDFL
jgi:hypothetical protein